MNFLKIFTFILSVLFLNAIPVHASELPENTETTSPKLPFRLTAEASHQLMEDFDYFQKLSDTRRENIETLTFLNAYAHKIGIGPDFTTIQSWIMNTESPEIMLPLATIAQLFNTKSAKKVTEHDLRDYIEGSKKASHNAFLVKFIQHHNMSLNKGDSGLLLDFSPLGGFIELDSDHCIDASIHFDTSFMGAVSCHSPPGMTFVPKDMDTFFKTLAVKLGYDNSEDLISLIDDLEADNNDKIERARLTHDFMHFAEKRFHITGTTMGLSLETSDVFLGESMASNGMLPKDFDIETAFQNMLLKQLTGSQLDSSTTHGVVGEFLSCFQDDPNLVKIFPELLDVHFEDGQITRDEVPLTTPLEDTLPPLAGMTHTPKGKKMIWALNLEGELRIHSDEKDCAVISNHHHLFEGNDLACAGWIAVTNGKITFINNNSGHYHPTLIHFLFALKHFKDLDIFAPNATSELIGSTQTLSLPELINLSEMIEVVGDD